MAKIEPFECLRPNPSVAARVAALPYDVFSSEEARKEVVREPLSFLAIDRAETNFPENCNPYDPCVYQKAKELLQKEIAEGVFIRDTTPKYYIYQLTMNQRTQTGIVACASIDDYLNGIIKKHEDTRKKKEEDRIQHVTTLKTQTGPIFLAYPRDEIIEKITRQEVMSQPVYDFVEADGIHHTVFEVSADNQEKLRKAFQSISSIYIADGHHRAAAAVQVGLEKRKENPDYTGKEPFNFFLSVLFPAEELFIYPYHRCVKDLNGYSKEEFLEKLAVEFEVRKNGAPSYLPQKKGEIGMDLEGTWYCLTCRKKESEDRSLISSLDVSILNDRVLKPILGILDPRTDQRIDFIGGIRGAKELERRVQTDMKVAFLMYPTSMEEICRVSDRGLRMPPKSTWFEPKLRSGLFLHEI